ncbi:helix-turn-helix domain-containing protein [Sphingomicrobium astaxanthinifaciens]|uniref:helix-turn-helix domain-containing protein n=1 Tax=Sphingomicrobium astaxanthinifaciens TaxID=1227949 RepID=UPI001FCA768B|nr:helix-turn-helix transcriptional regulator [Sphingomicrobium astaxanthinifaciens]MCJ7422318.1 helix-turn-helix transcriptional regulator [Sphingomicrobium astaxanthinifaciens]
MGIKVTLDAQLQRAGMTGKDLAEAIDLSQTQLSLFRSGKVKGIRFATLAAMCAALGCQPGDLIRFELDGEDAGDTDEGEPR